MITFSHCRCCLCAIFKAAVWTRVFWSFCYFPCTFLPLFVSRWCLEIPVLTKLNQGTLSRSSVRGSNSTKNNQIRWTGKNQKFIFRATSLKEEIEKQYSHLFLGLLFSTNSVLFCFYIILGTSNVNNEWSNHANSCPLMTKCFKE